MLYLGKNEIKNLANFKEIVEKIEESLLIYESGDFVLPDRISEYHNENNFLYMPYYSDKMMGTKVVTLFPDNPKENVPVLNGVMILNDVKTGVIKCILDGSSITSYRTGAVGATGAKYTSPEDASSLGLIGCGVQGYYQVSSTMSIRNIDKVTIFDINPDAMNSLKEKLLKDTPDLNVVLAKNTSELVKNSEIIITATTASNPIIENDAELLKGKHFVAIGSYQPEKREYPEIVYSLIEKLYVDVEFAKEESGDIIFPLKQGLIEESQLTLISSLIKKIDSKVSDKTTLFKSVGMAIFDVIVAEYFYEKAVALNMGTILE